MASSTLKLLHIDTRTLAHSASSIEGDAWISGRHLVTLFHTATGEKSTISNHTGNLAPVVQKGG